MTGSLEVVLGGAEDVERVRIRYPCLLWFEVEGSLVLRGGFPVVHEGEELDAFSVELQLHGGPRGFAPAVYEIGGRIPRILDRHVFPTSGSACLGLPEELLVETRGEPMTLLAFLDGPVRSYFLAQTIFERDGVWPFGDRRHGDEGLYDFFEETFGSRDPAVVGRYLRMLRADSVRGHAVCPCGSGRRIRRCHEAEVRSLQSLISPFAAARILAALQLRAASRPKDSAARPEASTGAARRRLGLLRVVQTHLTSPQPPRGHGSARMGRARARLTRV